MKVFLAGGTGYVGGHVLKALLTEGHEVTVFSRSADASRLPDGVEAMQGDLGDPETYRDRFLAAGFDAVVHAIGLIRNRRLKGQTFHRIMQEGTEGLASLARKAKAKHFTLISANGAQPEGTTYQETKWAAEKAVRESGITYTIFRPSIVFAKDDDFVNQMRSLMRLGAVPYFGRGDYELAPVHADDLARAVAKSLTVEAARDRIFHVCGPETYTYKAFLHEVKEASGSRGLVLRLPKWAVRTGAFLLGWIPAFPATNSALTMLFEGNTCKEHEWTKAFAITPVPMSKGIREYLGRDGADRPAPEGF